MRFFVFCFMWICVVAPAPNSTRVQVTAVARQMTVTTTRARRLQWRGVPRSFKKCHCCSRMEPSKFKISKKALPTLFQECYFGLLNLRSTIFFKGLDAWWTNFKTYIKEEKNVSDWRTTLVEDPFDDLDNGGNNSTSTTRRRTFPYLLSDFLYSRQGSKYKKNFHFKTNLTCNSPAPPITVSIQQLDTICII
jgi:hypothetical protein